ncbi:caspase family protein, partial [Bradyrhizobium centrolobii]|uniref:caspase family protein n=1 Tax=Bradyrhizobium centrolobii TaxID=1505087 RepID=UPI001FD9C672
MKTAFFALLTILALTLPAGAAERRIALVVGNANYQTGSLPTPANDAGLVAQTLQAAGFDVTGARDLDQESLRRAFRDFLDKSSSSGPDAVAYIYLSGYGVQLEGENYFVPVDARIANDTSVSAEALRLSDYIRPLSALHLKTVVIVLDLARANPFASSGNPLTGGLALVDAEPSTLIAFNAAPGTIAPDEAGPYSAYAQALAEISREGGLSIDDAFARVRLRVNQITNGGQVPWHASKLQAPISLFERAPDAPPPPVTAEQTASIRQRPIRDFDAREAYLAALDRDTLEGYEDFLAAYPNDPMARRVRAIVAARREAITWRRSRTTDTPQAYWSYLRRYPRGAHSFDARRRLAYLSAALEPPPSFAVIDYGLPPPPPDEIVFVDRPVLVFADPEFSFAPPPPPPVVFLPP